MSLAPWRTIAKPHEDVLKGTFQQAEFAADITQVVNGKAPPEYQDAAQFFARTFITEGMRLLLMSVARRLAGLGGDPVIQLQTAFGGGKTHTMLAVYHLAARQVAASELAGIPPLLDDAGITALPQARIAVLDGINLSAAQGRTHDDGITARTLWGEMAWQLAGGEGYQLVAADDAAGTAPAKDTLIALLQKAAPCVVLIDELQKFFAELQGSKALAAGTFEANLKFVQALTEAFKAVPNAVLLASLPESDTEAGGDFGQYALTALEKHFARVESVWKPVATEEAFEIIRRRLFADSGDKAEIGKVCRAFYDFYREHGRDFPADAQSAEYLARMCRAYPVHPEIFDRLYEDWTTLDKFQRTRGVLQYLAVVIHRLWNDNNQDALIMPGSLPLADSNVRDKSIHYLPTGWQAVLETEVDGARSTPEKLDGQDTRFGSVQAAQRVMRTIFLGSAPEVAAQNIRGIQRERILLGSVQPGENPGIFGDVLGRLRDRLHYLYADNDRYWLDTRPNLRREMESRRGSFSNEKVRDIIRLQLESILGGSNSCFEGRHVFTPAADIPDDYGRGLRLVVLPSTEAYTRQNQNAACKEAEKILHHHGNQPRQKRNRLLFLAADGEMTARLYDECRTSLAWQQIVSELDHKKLNLDTYQADQARSNKDNAAAVCKQTLRNTYRWLLNPLQESAEKSALTWEAVAITTSAPNLMQEIENRVYAEEWAIKEWSPVHLRNLLEKWYFKADAPEANALKVWQDSCCYLYMPRLVNDGVYKDAINKGLASQDFFAFAYNKNGDKYEGFTFGENIVINLDEKSLLIARATAQAYAAQLAAERAATTPTATTTTSGSTPSGDSSGNASGGAVPAPAPTSTVKTHFYAATALDPVMAKKRFNSIADEIIQNFTEQTGMTVQVTLEIQVESADGFDRNLQRAVCENCHALEIEEYEFE